MLDTYLSLTYMYSVIFLILKMNRNNSICLCRNIKIICLFVTRLTELWLFLFLFQLLFGLFVVPVHLTKTTMSTNENNSELLNKKSSSCDNDRVADAVSLPNRATAGSDQSVILSVHCNSNNNMNSPSVLSEMTAAESPSKVLVPQKRNLNQVLMGSSSSKCSTRKLFTSDDDALSTLRSTSLSSTKSSSGVPTLSNKSSQEDPSYEEQQQHTNDLMETFKDTGVTNERFQNFDKPNPEVSAKYKLVKRRNATAKVWNYFHVFESYEDESKCPAKYLNKHNCYAVCNDCGEIISYCSSGKKRTTTTTSGVIRHLLNKHHLSNTDISNSVGSNFVDLVDNSLVSAFNRSNDPKYTSPAHKNEVLKRLTAEWLAKDLLPFSTVQSPSFRKLIKTHNSRSTMFTNITMKNKMREIENEIRQYIVSKIKKDDSWISITLDHWTSINKQNYTGLFEHCPIFCCFNLFY